METKRSRRREKRANKELLPLEHTWNQPKNCWFSATQKAEINSKRGAGACSVYYRLLDGTIVEITEANHLTNSEYNDAVLLGQGFFHSRERVENS